MRAEIQGLPAAGEFEDLPGMLPEGFCEWVDGYFL